MKKAILVWIIALILFGVYFGLQIYFDYNNTEPVFTQINAPETAEEDKSYITITAVGDCTFGSDINGLGGGSFEAEAINNNNDYSYFFRNVAKYFNDDDLTIINLEGALSKRGVREDKEYAFRGLPEYGNILSSSSVEAANLANNHSMDYGSIAYEDTRQTLDEYGVLGFGKNKYVIKEIKGFKIGLIGTNTLNYAERTNYPKVMEELKSKNPDIIIACFHWGEENEATPTQIQKQLAHHAIDNGADLVIGHHPHVIQGIEKYNGKYILYSLGNFCFGGNRNPGDKDTMIFRQKFFIKDEELLLSEDDASIIPCSISSVKERNNFQPTPLTGEGYDRVKSKIIERSNSFEGIEDIIFTEG